MSTERKKEIKSGIIMIIIVVGIIATLWFISVSISKGSSNISNKGITWNVDFIDEDGNYGVVVYGNDVNKNYYFTIYDDENNELILPNSGPDLSKDSDVFYLEKDKKYTIKTNSDNIYQIRIFNFQNENRTLYVWNTWEPNKVYKKEIENINNSAIQGVGNNAKEVLG